MINYKQNNHRMNYYKNKKISSYKIDCLNYDNLINNIMLLN